MVGVVLIIIVSPFICISRTPPLVSRIFFVRFQRLKSTYSWIDEIVLTLYQLIEISPDEITFSSNFFRSGVIRFPHPIEIKERMTVIIFRILIINFYVLISKSVYSF